MTALSEKPTTCPNCSEPFTEVDITGEEMLNEDGKQVCLVCFHDRFLTRFKQNMEEVAVRANLAMGHTI